LRKRFQTPPPFVDRKIPLEETTRLLPHIPEKSAAAILPLDEVAISFHMKLMGALDFTNWMAPLAVSKMKIPPEIVAT